MTDKSTIDLKSLRQSLRDPKHKIQGRRFNRYDLLQEISRGGMGIVVRAKHQELGSLVALKLLASQDPTPEATARFRREAKVLAQLKHPHVVGISDLGEDAGIHFLAMELIEGPDLHSIVKDMVAKNTYLSFARVAEVGLAMAKALDYCHEKGAIHRDIKPQNILIEHKTDRPVLTDFGLVKRDQSKMASGQSAAISQAGKILGTPSFMAPEQFEPDGQFGKVGPKSDVWGLGATLFFCLTGQPPYTATNVVNLYSAVMNDPPPKVSDVREGVPPALEAICAACLTKDVGERISMADLVSKLEELKTDPKLLEGPKGNAGLRHAAIVIGIFVALAIFHLTVIDSARGKKILRAITGGEEAPEVPSTDGGETPPRDGGAGDKDVQRANDGEVDAMLRLAEKAAGAKDYAEALRRYEQAGNAGEVRAMFEAGKAHAGLEEWSGRLPEDSAKAKDWFKKAASQGHEGAMLEMANLTLAHPKVAKAWFEQVLGRPGPDSEVKKKASAGLEQLQKNNPDLND